MAERDRRLRFERYAPEHRRRLRELAAGPEWAPILAREATLREWREAVRVPPSAPGQQTAANRYLRERNAGRVRALLDEGVADREPLLRALGDWESALAGDDAFPVVFLGLVLTLDCSFLPRCIYCNQLWAPRRLTLDDWKGVLDEVAEPVPPYVYLTGGEPLLLGAEVWGDQGIVAHATRRGSAVNINTNASLITPVVALQMVKVGLFRLHVSLDAPDRDTQDGLLGRVDRMDSVIRGILNVQIAREVLGADHPTIHVNCVLTARNLFQVPDLLRFLVGLRRRPEGGDPTEDPLFPDFAFHLIPVGGSENGFLRPTAEEWRRFYTETWDSVEEVWAAYEAGLGIPEAERRSLNGRFPFASPWHRTDHGMPLGEYCERAARGEYWQGALTDRCYVAPTQAFVLPDGTQHWCGAHAIRRPYALGNVTETGVRETIRRNIARLADHPNEHCTGCAGATCVINRAARRNLEAQVGEWQGEHTGRPRRKPPSASRPGGR